MVDEYEQFLQARWALQINDPRYVIEEFKEFNSFIWLRREALKLPSEEGRAIDLSWLDLTAWAVLAASR